MVPDSHEVLVDKEPRQATLIFERLKTLRGEFGMLGEDIINLLQSAGVTPLAEPDSGTKKSREQLRSL